MKFYDDNHNAHPGCMQGEGFIHPGAAPEKAGPAGHCPPPPGRPGQFPPCGPASQEPARFGPGAPHAPGPRGAHPAAPGPHGPAPHGPAPHGFAPHGPAPRRPQGKLTENPRYAAEDVNGKLLTLLRVLGHMGHHLDVRGGQGRILSILKENGEMTQRELTEQLGIQPGSASEIIGKLEKAGLLIRTPNPTDRRTADISLTEAGAARAAEAEAKTKDRREELMDALTEDEKAALLPMLEKLCAAWEDKRPAPGRRQV